MSTADDDARDPLTHVELKSTEVADVEAALSIVSLDEGSASLLVLSTIHRLLFLFKFPATHFDLSVFLDFSYLSKKL